MKIIGVDEVGRGPWSGPVVAAAVLGCSALTTLPLQDSKVLSANQREKLSHAIASTSCWAIGIATVDEVDGCNIRQATFLAMRRAVEGIEGYQEARVRVDGRDVIPHLLCQHCEAVIQGDRHDPIIAAASIMAKVFRDRLMSGYLHTMHPAYGFDRHKGYGTAQHQDALQNHGICCQHRQSFKPIKGYQVFR